MDQDNTYKRKKTNIQFSDDLFLVVTVLSPTQSHDIFFIHVTFNNVISMGPLLV